jgi:hypothetical protein
MRKYIGTAWFAAAGLCSLVPAPGHAESGTAEIALSFKSNVYAVQMGETTVTASGGDGTLTFIHGSARPFVEGASAPVQYASFAKNTPSGLELEADGVATFSPDDTLLLLFERRSDDIGTSGEGKLRLMGGSGRFAGIDGQCKYKANDVSGDWNVIANCEWLFLFPYR